MEAAQRLYHLAVQRGFTKGRRVAQVAAACLYVVCRLDGQPFMLIDFSDMLQVGTWCCGGAGAADGHVVL
jgi:transcription factor IIIB subunit 2